MKKVYLSTGVLILLIVLMNTFMTTIVEKIGVATIYIAIIIFYMLYALSFIIIAYTAKWITTVGIGGIFRKKEKNLTLDQWTSNTKYLDNHLKLLIGCMKVTGDIIDNMGVLKNRIGYYFQNDVYKMKRFKAYLNVVERDSTPVVIQTFIIAVFSSAFASSLATGNIKYIIGFFIPITNESNGVKISGEFYYVSGTMFLLMLIMIMISFLISYTDRTRIRIIQEVIDIYIDELDGKYKSKSIED
ncbi:hypothetical protein [Bacillus multifaciens]|uniref:hypothetical protein n=1 Tax=Bacillus multifaciens TaxID=3068506 RepID=UPI002740D930|nr:hypothetical protein [Bacillus sp. WLY-B-L8]MDP7981021.1 hypothetical protein [Bacillus sp. WLY-B-L8]